MRKRRFILSTSRIERRCDPRCRRSGCSARHADQLASDDARPCRLARARTLVVSVAARRADRTDRRADCRAARGRRCERTSGDGQHPERSWSRLRSRRCQLRAANTLQPGTRCRRPRAARELASHQSALRALTCGRSARADHAQAPWQLCRADSVYLYESSCDDTTDEAFLHLHSYEVCDD